MREVCLGDIVKDVNKKPKQPDIALFNNAAFVGLEYRVQHDTILEHLLHPRNILLNEIMKNSLSELNNPSDVPESITTTSTEERRFHRATKGPRKDRMICCVTGKPNGYEEEGAIRKIRLLITTQSQAHRR
jgi:hypothetical protein